MITLRHESSLSTCTKQSTAGTTIARRHLYEPWIKGKATRQQLGKQQHKQSAMVETRYSSPVRQPLACGSGSGGECSGCAAAAQRQRQRRGVQHRLRRQRGMLWHQRTPTCTDDRCSEGRSHLVVARGKHGHHELVDVRNPTGTVAVAQQTAQRALVLPTHPACYLLVVIPWSNAVCVVQAGTRPGNRAAGRRTTLWPCHRRHCTNGHCACN